MAAAGTLRRRTRPSDRNRQAPDAGGWNRPAADPRSPSNGWNRQGDPQDQRGESWGRQTGDADPHGGGWNRPGGAPDPLGPRGQGWGRPAGDADAYADRVEPAGPRVPGWNQQADTDPHGNGWNRQGGDGWGRPGAGPEPGQGPVAGQGPLGGRGHWGAGASRRAGTTGGAGGAAGAGGARGYSGGIPPYRERPGGGRLDGADGVEAGGPVIRQREAALPDKRPLGAAQPVASIAPDGLESFARDLRALRAKAKLEYPEMAETSHFTMKTLASAAAGCDCLPCPSQWPLCGLAAATWSNGRTGGRSWPRRSPPRRRRSAAATTTSRGPGTLRGLARSGRPRRRCQAPDADSGEVYVITSAKPRQPGW